MMLRRAKIIPYLFVLGIFIAPVHSAFAHKVKIGTDVGGTLHIEPNDSPRAGEPAKAWFALTRKGGKEIPLQECNCQLAVYAEPHRQGEPALLAPPLKSVVAERYQGIPGTEITFPRPGLYQLQLTGKPASGASFKPFVFNFTVTVAAGSSQSKNTQNSQNVNQNLLESRSQNLPLWGFALLILPIIGISAIILQRLRLGSGKGKGQD